MTKKTLLLTNFIAPYRLPLFRTLRQLLGQLVILISTEMEHNRKWDGAWEDLDVVLQKSITVKKQWKHPHGFSDNQYIHFPLDTIFLLNRHRPDNIISVEFGLRTFFALVHTFFHPNCKLIIWAAISMTTEMGRGINRLILRKWLLKNCDAVLVNGASGRKYINSLGFPDERIFTVPYPTDTKLFASVDINKNFEESYRLLYMGQIVERKGLLLFLKPLIEWVQTNAAQAIELWICGSGNQKEIIANIDIPKNLIVKFIDEVPYQQIPSIYRHCGALIFPTLADEWGLVVNEAMASGLVVLGSYYSQAVEELVEDGKNGWRFHPDQPEEIMESLTHFFNTPQTELTQMRIYAQETAKKISIEYAAKCMYDAIQYVKSK